jgi:hypothetical protein
LRNLKQRANAQAVEGMARFGIRPAQALGISMPTLRKMAKEIGRDQPYLFLLPVSLETGSVDFPRLSKEGAVNAFAQKGTMNDPADLFPAHEAWTCIGYG